MNFFAAQDKARRNTALLVLLFIAAIASITGTLFLVVHWASYGAPPAPGAWDQEMLLGTATGVLAVVVAGSLFKLAALSFGGGQAVAESMGGRLVSDPQNPAERRLQNIVAEMALASGCPAPQLYVIPDQSINAFAAGRNLGDAVIGVTRGSLDSLSRDEMQGVIAHEFSHIVNGDMRISMRMIAVIHGMLLLSYLGYRLLHFGALSRNRNAAAMFMGGIALIIAGLAGAFFGGLIRSAVSRQREFLADAAAVQYTRNPRGIGGALQRIGIAGGILASPEAGQCAHMFFAHGVKASLSNMFASHPPLDERISRIIPGWDGQEMICEPLKSQPSKPAAATPPSPAPGLGAAGFASGFSANATPATDDSRSVRSEADENNLPDLFTMLFGGEEAAESLLSRAGEITPDDFAAAGQVLRSLSPALSAAMKDSYAARALIYAMLLDEKDQACRDAQLAHLRAFADRGVYDLTIELADELQSLPHAARLPLLLQTPPALRTMSAAQYERFANNLHELIAADEKVDLFEWALEAALLHYLDDGFGVAGRRGARPRAARSVAYALSILARAGHGEDAPAVFARRAPKASYQDDPFDPDKLYDAMRAVTALSPSRRRRFLQDAVAIAAHDGVINSDEGALLRAFAAILDCPLPPFPRAAQG